MRRTVVDWKLLEDALAFVQFIARDEKRMHEQRVRDNRGDASEPEVGGLRKGDGKEGMSLSPVMELFSAETVPGACTASRQRSTRARIWWRIPPCRRFGTWSATHSRFRRF